MLIRTDMVSGRYRGRAGDFEVQLRVDVDGPRPMRCFSADYYRVRGEQPGYVGSVRVDAAQVTFGAGAVQISGRGLFSWDTPTETLHVTIARVKRGATPAAVLRHFSLDGAPRASYRCAFESRFFREVRLEEAVEQGVEPFRSYDTGSLPSGGPAQTLSYVGAYAQAGVEMVAVDERQAVAMPAVSANDSWSDAELQAAMQLRFTAWADVPQWAIWLLHARLHDVDRGTAPGTARLFGLMFDRRGLQRQGCALFYEGMKGSAPDRQRTQLYTCVHELGHGFNLLHCWQLSLAKPPLPSRPRALTWMAYPDYYPGGAPAFWDDFGFQFDDPELIHIRHALREDVIMGGNPFLAGAAFEREADWQYAGQPDPGLRLEVSGPRVLPLGLPVAVDLALSGTTREGRLAPPVLGPRPMNVDIAIRSPGIAEFTFEPLLHHCRNDPPVLLRSGDPPVRDSAFIHYGKDGFAFDRPGVYEIRARCTTPDGATVLSNVLQITVRGPVTRSDRAVAELMLGPQQGTLLALCGSDAPQLRHGNDALQEVIDRYPGHPAALVARVVRATNAARPFKSIGLDGAVALRASQPAAVVTLLRDVLGTAALRTAARAGDESTATANVLAGLARIVGVSPAATGVANAFIRSRIGEVGAALPDAVRLARSAPIPSRIPAVRSRTRPVLASRTPPVTELRLETHPTHDHDPPTTG